MSTDKRHKRRAEDGADNKAKYKSKRPRRDLHYESDSSSMSSVEPEKGSGSSAKNHSKENGIIKAHSKSAKPQKLSKSKEKDSIEAENDSDDSNSDLSDSSSGSEAPNKKLRKRNDPSAFSTSMTKILSTKLPTNRRSDPVLSRSKGAATAAESLASGSLDKKARAALTAQKKAALESGRVKDVLSADGRRPMGEVQEEEKRLRRTAQKGVIKLFNAVRAAQVKAEEAEKASRAKGLIGRDRKGEEKTELSKQGFMELINGVKDTEAEKA